MPAACPWSGRVQGRPTLTPSLSICDVILSTRSFTFPFLHSTLRMQYSYYSLSHMRNFKVARGWLTHHKKLRKPDCTCTKSGFKNMLSTVRVILINKLLFSRHNEFLSFNNEGSETEQRTCVFGGGGVRASSIQATIQINSWSWNSLMRVWNYFINI